MPNPSPASLQETPLFIIAIDNGSEAVASMLLEKMYALGGAAEQAVSAADQYGKNVLHRAAAEGMTDIAQAVLKGASDEAAVALLAAQNKASHCIAFDNLGP